MYDVDNKRLILQLNIMFHNNALDMNETQKGYHYNLDLPQDITSIIEQDFWMLENIGPAMLSALSEPVKFASSSWIIITSGHAKVDINLISYEVKAPMLIAIRSTQIMQPSFISEDFNASVVVMSKRFRENLFLLTNSSSLYQLQSRHSVVPIPPELLPSFIEQFKTFREIVQDTSNPHASKALVFSMAAFFYRILYKCYESFKDEVSMTQGRISDKFLNLVQQYFRQHRFLEFYANELEITPKHLSRTVKAQTGFTAVEWIERFVILESKVLLKSSNLNIQQIADELNFPSQSFFGKYFKKVTGMTPKEFRNS